MPDIEEQEYPEANANVVRSLAGAVATTYGPTPRDKMIIGADQEMDIPGVDPPGYQVTSDAATILQKLELNHPVMPILERVIGPERPGETDVKGQDIPDGITGTVVLTAALLDEAMDLITRGLHPRTVQRGYRNALEIARSEVETLACSVDGHRHETARSALTGNVAGGEKERFSEFAVEIVEAVGRPRPEVFGISTISQGEIEASRLVDGVVLDRNRITDRRMPRRVDNGTVLVLDGQDEGGLRTLELNERYNASVSNHAELAALQDTDAGRRARIIQKLREHDVDIVVAKQGIEKEYAVELADHEIVGIDGVTRLYLSRVARATGAEPVKRTEDFDTESLGHVGTLREVAGDPLGEQQKRRRMVILEDCVDPGAMSMLLHGVWGQLADNTTTEIRKAAVAVARAEGLGHAKPGIVPGGGATDTRVSMSVRNEADTVDSREQLAQRAFADAVEMLVFTLGKNIGYDPYAVRPELREANNNTSVPFGIVFPQREIADTVDAGVVDPVATKLRSYVVATEAATLLLRIDDAIPATFSESAPDPNDTIYEDAAEQQQSYIKKHDDTRYNR